MWVLLQPGKDIFPCQEWKANRSFCILYTRKQSKKHGNLTRILVLLDSLLDYIRDATEHVAPGILERLSENLPLSHDAPTLNAPVLPA